MIFSTLFQSPLVRGRHAGTVTSLAILASLGIALGSSPAVLAQQSTTAQRPDDQSATQPSSSSPSADKGIETQVREIAELHRELRRLEKGTAKAKSDEGRAQNISQLCQLFIEVGQHPDIAKSPTLQSLSVRLRTRLRGIERRTSDELRRRGIAEPEEYTAMLRKERANRARGSQSPRTNSIGFRKGQTTGTRNQVGDRSRDADLKNRDTVAASTTQQLGHNRRTNGEGDTSIQNDNSASSASNENSSSGSKQHGSSSSRSNLSDDKIGGNAAPGPDYSWQLVNLIHMTIQPDYWSVAGGPGKAIYFGNARALVIHGSWRVQEDVADLLTALRGG